MAEQCIAHICSTCGSAWKTRDRAKKHVNRDHGGQVSHKHGPGRHVKYLWLDLAKYLPPSIGGDHERSPSTAP